jgi:hypothetical protein
VAKEKVYAGPQILWRLSRPAKQDILYTEPLLGRVAGLGAVLATVPEVLPVVLAPLAPSLLKEAANGRSSRVLCITVPVRNL